MKKSCSAADLFDPQTTMDSDYSTSGAKEAVESSGDISFSFAFNNDLFSDRVLRIEVIAGPPENKHDGDGCSSILDWARNRKRRREEIKKENGQFHFKISPFS